MATHDALLLVDWQLDPEAGRFLGVETGTRSVDWLSPERWATLDDLLAEVHPDDRAELRDRLAALGPGEHVMVEGRALPGRHGCFRGMVRTCGVGGRRVLCGHFVDVTHELEGARILARSEERFRLAFDASPDAINLNRLEDGTYLDVNAAFTRLMGWTLDEVRGRTSIELGIWRDPAERERLVEGLRARGRIDNLEADFVDKFGHVHRGLMSARVLEFDGEPVILSVTRDITEQVQVERRLRRLQHLEALGTLAAGIAHDLNNILTVLTGNLGLLRAELDRHDPRRELVDDSFEALERAASLSRQFLAFAKGGEPRRQAVDLAELLGRLLRLHFSGTAVRWELDVEPELPPVVGDPELLSQVVGNLASNARHFLAGGGRVSVRARRRALGEGELPPLPAGEWIEVVFADDGPGIPPEHLDRVFEPYFTTRETGHGLGLATVHGIVTRHGGHVSVSSEPGAGTRFQILLPAGEGEAGEADRPGAAPAASPTFSGLRVLVMDDEPAIRKLMERILARLGCESVVVEHGEAALARCREASAEGRPFDVAILDLTVRGGMGGIEAARQLGTCAPPRPRLVAASGYSDHEAFADPAAYGFEGALPKPITPAAVEAVLRAVLSG